MQQQTTRQTQHSQQRGPYRAARSDPQGLTPRERCVFALLHQGLSNRAMAKRLCRSERTVEHHVSTLFAKLGIASRREFAGCDFKNWVLPPRPD
jgi:DNA-binding NarL/FixJ family response regulator